MPHRHECHSCGCVWEHDPDAPGFDEDTAHDCPRCGACQTVWYEGSKKSDYRMNRLGRMVKVGRRPARR